MTENYFFNMIPAEEKARLHYLPTIPELLDKLAVEYGPQPAVNHRGQVTTYAELCSRVARRRSYINGLGLSKDAKIAVFDRNSQDAIELFLAVMSAGYTVIMLPAQLAGPALAGSMLKFQVEAMFVRDEFMPVVEAAGVKVSCHPAAAIAEEESPCNPTISKDTLAAIFFTGGTTGVPKGAMLTHGNLMRGAFNGVFMPGSVLKDHRYICFLPFSHVFGSIRSMLSCLMCGAQLFTCEDMKAGIGSIPKIRPTCLVLVPGMVEILIGMAKMYGPAFLGGELKTIISGAANVPPRLIAAMQELGIELLQGYGLTESANFTAGNGESPQKPTSVGRIYPGQETRIVDGELQLKGDNIFQGYYGDSRQTQEAFTDDGWFRTGDLVRFDEEGYLYIVGRIKNLIVLSNGENVSPEALEEPFYKRPFIKDCLVKEMPDGDSSIIGIEILPNMPYLEGMTPEQIAAKMQETVDEINAENPSQWHIRRMIVRTEDFKRTGSLKIARNQ